VWRYISYADVADALEVVLRRSPLAGFDGQLLEHYAQFARALHRLGELSGRLTDEEPVELVGTAAGLLRGIRMYDAVGKLRARSAIGMIEAGSRVSLGDLDIRWEANFTNGSPLLGAYLRGVGDDQVGWQYQHGQWRLAVICAMNVGRTEGLRAAREEHVAAAYSGWMDFGALSGITGREPVIPGKEAKGGFNRYDPDFVYRYRKLPGLTVSEISALSDHYLGEAVRLFDS
jgi:hypothetical protein